MLVVSIDSLEVREVEDCKEIPFELVVPVPALSDSVVWSILVVGAP